MADTTTTKHALVKPEVHASDDTWGTKLNADLDQLDSLIDIRSTTAEVLTGTAANRTVTPDALAALWEQGVSVASAATMALGDGGYFIITGAATVTDIDFAVDKAGRTAWLLFAGAVTFTHSATLICPGAVNFTAVGNDKILIISEGSDIIRVLAWFRHDGSIIAGAASTTDVLTGTNTTKPVTSDALAALWERGADVTAAANTILGDGGVFVILGSTTITDIDFQTARDGRTALLWFANSPTITHSANLVCPGSVSIAARSGDMALVHQLNGDQVAISNYIRADGTIDASNGQIAFPAAENASAGVNVLDDYEEGTATLALSAAGTAPTGVVGGGNLTYTKIGRLVYFEGRFTLTNKGAGGVGSILLMQTGLPTGVNLAPIRIIRYAGITLPSGGIGMFGFLTGSGAYIEVYTQTNTTTPSVTWADITNTTDFFIAGCYRTAT